jgi:hypothetical protein
MQMPTAQAESYDANAPKAIVLTIGLFVLTWLVSDWIIQGSSQYLVLACVGCAGVVVFMTIVRDWRSGVFIFLGWLVLEDQIRKYLGNNLMIFFAKDVLAGVTYVSMWAAYRRGRLLTFKPPFMLWLGIFFWMAALQVMNPNSPSVFYGLLGMKTYFYYVPLMLAGYAILRTDADLHKILMLNMWIALIVSGFGLLQSFGGGAFLTPKDIAPELYVLTHVQRNSGKSGSEFIRSSSLFVSDARFAQFLIFLFILALGTAGYLLVKKTRGRYLVFGALGAITVATIMCGVRSPIVYLIVDAIVLSVAMMWGAPWRQRQAFRLGKTVSIAIIIGAISIWLTTALFPDAIHRRWEFYSDALAPTGAHTELGSRAWDYPIIAIRSVFNQPNWQWGNGTGVNSLGTQYVARAFGVQPPNLGAESGYGSLITEFGIIGPIVWTLWTVGVILSAWKVVKELKQTPLFPIGFAIFWHAFLLLGPFTFYGLNGYQNYLSNAYLWLTVGMLFRMPGLLEESRAAAALQDAPPGT